MAKKPYQTRSKNGTWTVGKPDQPAPRRTSAQVAEERQRQEAEAAADAIRKDKLLKELAELDKKNSLREVAANQPSVPPSHLFASAPGPLSPQIPAEDKESGQPESDINPTPSRPSRGKKAAAQRLAASRQEQTAPVSFFYVFFYHRRF